MSGEGRTAAAFRCPCSDVEAPARTSFWVELVGVPGFPSALYGVCARCRDKWVGVAEGNVGDYKVKRWFGPGLGPVVQVVRATWELGDLSAAEAEEILSAAQAVEASQR